MNKKIVLSLLIILISLITSCSDRDYITGQVGPSRGIVFTSDNCDIEAQLYNNNDLMSYNSAELNAEEFVVDISWKKTTSDFRLPTVQEANLIVESEYSKALWSKEDSPKYIWCEGDVAFNYDTKLVEKNVENASLVVVRNISSCVDD